MTVIHPNIWRIRAHPVALERAAEAWRAYATRARDVADRIDGSVRALLDLCGHGHP